MISLNGNKEFDDSIIGSKASFYFNSKGEFMKIISGEETKNEVFPEEQRITYETQVFREESEGTKNVDRSY